MYMYMYYMYNYSVILTGKCNCTVGTLESFDRTVAIFLGLNGLTINLPPLLLLSVLVIIVVLSVLSSVRDLLGAGSV